MSPKLLDSTQQVENFQFSAEDILAGGGDEGSPDSPTHTM